MGQLERTSNPSFRDFASGRRECGIQAGHRHVNNENPQILRRRDRSNVEKDWYSSPTGKTMAVRLSSNARSCTDHGLDTSESKRDHGYLSETPSFDKTTERRWMYVRHPTLGAVLKYTTTARTPPSQQEITGTYQKHLHASKTT